MQKCAAEDVDNKRNYANNKMTVLVADYSNLNTLSGVLGVSVHSDCVLTDNINTLSQHQHPQQYYKK